MSAEEPGTGTDRADVPGPEAADAPTFEELDAAAVQAADEQWRLLTESAELDEHGTPEELATAAEAAQPIHKAGLALFDRFDESAYDYDDLFYGDPAVAAAEALEQDRAEEYAAYLAESGLDPEHEYSPELAIE